MFTLPRTITKATAIAVLLGTTIVSASTFASSPGNMAPDGNNMNMSVEPNTTPTETMSTQQLKNDVMPQSDTRGQAPSAQPAMASDDSEAAAPKHMKSMHEDPAQMMKKHVEVRIKTLHDELKITPAQESQWAPVAQTMRDNEQSMAALIEARHNNKASMTAVDDIKSYQGIAQSHADGLGKFVAAFEPLYNSMSDDQKKTADSFFNKDAHHGHHKHGMKKSSMTK